jgi:hypothetical protein
MTHRVRAEYSLQDDVVRYIEYFCANEEEFELDAWFHIIEKHDLKVIKRHNPGVPLRPDDANNIKIISIREIT